MSNIDFVDEGKSKAKIKVVGVGGCGGNTVNSLLGSSLNGEVGMYAVNTDAQALEQIKEGGERIQIGHHIAKGLGVGADYMKAQEAARQDQDRLEEMVSGSDMVFITAGMGGGTGTGAAPVIAEICRNKEILTAAVVTKPYIWENRQHNVAAGIEMLSKYVDSIIIVPNDRVSEVYGADISMAEAFKHSDDILSNAVAGICEIIYCPGQINVDFADVRKVMSEMGQAMMGTATESGVDRAARAANAVIECPLLEGVKLSNARGMLINVTADAESLSTSELSDAMSVIRKTASDNVALFFGLVNDKEMGESIRITLIATGLDRERQTFGGTTVSAQPPIKRRTGGILQGNRKSNLQGNLLGEEDKDLPTLLRRQHS